MNDKRKKNKHFAAMSPMLVIIMSTPSIIIEDQSTESIVPHCVRRSLSLDHLLTVISTTIAFPTFSIESKRFAPTTFSSRDVASSFRKR